MNEQSSMEDEPLFAVFLKSLLQYALAHPEELFDASELLAEDAAWLAELGF
jgi:hypothetical protein